MKKHILITLSFLISIITFGQNTFTTSDKSVYESRLKSYNDSLNLWKDANKAYKDFNSKDELDQVTKSEFIDKCGKSKYDNAFTYHSIEPVKFYYGWEIKKKGDCICEGFKKVNYTMVFYKKPKQRVVYIEPKECEQNVTPPVIKETIQKPKPKRSEILPMVIKTVELDIIEYPLSELKLIEVVSINIPKVTYNVYSAKGYPMIDKNTGASVLVPLGYSKEWTKHD